METGDPRSLGEWEQDSPGARKARGKQKQILSQKENLSVVSLAIETEELSQDTTSKRRNVEPQAWEKKQHLVKGDHGKK